MITSAAEITAIDTSVKIEYPYLAVGKNTRNLYMVLGHDVSSRKGDPYYRCMTLVQADGGPPVGEISGQRGSYLRKVVGTVKIVMTSK